MSALTRSDLERAAADYFRRLAEEVDAPRGFDKDNLTAEVALNVEASRDRITDLDDQLSSNDFEGKVRWRADRMVEPLGVSFGDLDERQQLFALQLAARAEREQMQLLMHLLTTPARNFQASDDLFLPAPSSGAPTIATPERRDRSPLLTEVTEEYLARKVRARRGRSQITELTRAFGWLSEVAGPRATLASVTREMMREFRDDVQRLERLRGQKTSFKARLTNNPHDQIAHVTAKRYWGSIQSFFAWCVAERGLPSDPAAGLKLEKNRREVRRSPEAFTQEELQRLFATPLYAGHKSPDRVMQPGTCHRRRGHWWSGILLMHTGLRAGELSQLHPSDFYFDEEVPFLRVTDEGEHGAEKFVKNAASVRDVPLAPVLLTLGLREFVEARKKRKPNGRVFFEFRLGTNGRTSEGLTRYWGDMLKKFGLWAEGRSIGGLVARTYLAADPEMQGILRSACIGPGRWPRVVGDLVFLSEGGLLANRSCWPEGDRLRTPFRGLPGAFALGGRLGEARAHFKSKAALFAGIREANLQRGLPI